MNQPIIQHYVPKMLLRGFGNGKKDQLWVFDKTNSRAFSSNVKNIASENRFYDCEINGVAVSLEESFGKLETKAKDAIQCVLADDSVKNLTEEQRSWLALFVATQFTRTRAFRENYAAFPELMRKHIAKKHPDTDVDKLIPRLTENELKAETLSFVVKSSHEFASHINDKSWFLAKTSRACPFLLGDNPVTLQNHRDFGVFGNLGLAVPGIEIYLPLSSTRALAMWCNSLKKQVTDSASALRANPWVAPQLSNPAGLLEMDAAIRNMSALAYTPSNVENFNSLQVFRSERYLFGSINDFSLAERMISANPRLRKGERMGIVGEEEE